MSAGDHPAVKIITLLGKLQTQVKEEGQAEEHAYAKFTYAGEDALLHSRAVLPAACLSGRTRRRYVTILYGWTRFLRALQSSDSV